MLNYLPEPLPLGTGLSALTLEDLAALGGRLGLKDGLASKARLLAEIPARLTDGAALRRLIRELPPPEAHVLFVAAASEHLAPLVGAGALFRYGATAPPPGLVTRGLLLPDFTTGISRPPAEILAVVDEEAARALLDGGVDAPATTVALPPRSAVRDAVAIWCYVYKNGVTLTQSGAAPKRALAKIAALLEVTEDEEPLATLQNLFGQSRLETLVNDVDRRCAFRRRENELSAADWLSGRAATFEDDFGAELAAAAMFEDDTGGAPLIVYALALAPVGKWFLLKTLGDGVRKFGGRDEAPLTKAVFTLFVGGFLAAGVTADGRSAMSRVGPFARSPASPTAAPEFLVGANFELKAPYDLDVATRLKMEAFADQVAGGRFLSYVITKNSFYRASDDGIAVDDILTFLAAHTPRGIPQNIEFTLRDWASQYGAVAFSDTLLLTAATPDLADEIVNLAEITPLVRRRVNLYGLEIGRADYDAARAALVAAGYLPRSLVKATDGVSARVLFDDGAPAGAPRATALAPTLMTAAVVDFAVNHQRRLKLWLAGETEPVTATPRRLYNRGGETHLAADGPAGRLNFPVKAIEKAVLA